jgi:hypothetical protein
MKDKLLAFVTILSIGGLSSTVGVAVFWYTDGLVGDSWAAMPMMLISPIVVILFIYACIGNARRGIKGAMTALTLMLAIYASGFAIPLLLLALSATANGFKGWLFPVLLGVSGVEIAVILWAMLTATKKARRVRSTAQLHR